MTTTAKAGGTSGRAKTATITQMQMAVELREAQVDIRYMRKWMYALSACMVLMLGGFGWMDARMNARMDRMEHRMDVRMDRLDVKFDRLYELLLKMQQQQPRPQPATPPTRQPTIPTTQEPPDPDDRPDVGRQAKRADPDQ